MKIGDKIVKLLRCFFSIEGALVLVIWARNHMALFGGKGNLNAFQLKSIYIGGLFIALAHVIINSEYLIQTRKRILRILLAIFISFPGICIYVYLLGIQDYVGQYLDRISREWAVLVYGLCLCVSALIEIAIFIVIETNHQKESKRLQTALERYKQENVLNQ